VKGPLSDLTYRRITEPLWLIAYDVRHPKRWRRLYERLCSVGLRLQYSVFLLSLQDAEIEQLVEDIRTIIVASEDDVRLYHLPAGTEVWYGQPPSAEGVTLFLAGLESFW